MTNGHNTADELRRIVLIRHEHTELAGTFCGHLDPSLDSEGRARLMQLAESLGEIRFRSIYSSDLRRAAETAQALAAANCLPIRLRSELRELAFGEWEGLRWDQIVARDPAFSQRWLPEYPALPAPGGEDFAHFVARVQRVMSEIADETPEQCAAVVTHAGVIRTILSSVTLERHTPIDLSTCPYGSWWEIWRRDKRWVLHRCSSTGVLRTHEGSLAQDAVGVPA